MRFIHTADWQIGKTFRQFGDSEAVLQAARFDVIETIGQLALDEGAEHVLVAGDVYDTDSPAPSTLRAPIERMRAISSVTWHLLPGNHDPHRPQGLWERIMAMGLPANIRLHLEPSVAEIASGVSLLPSPLTRKSESRDLTAWMDNAVTPEGALRIGLGHGSVAGFGVSGEGDADNPIDPARPAKAGLAYLALGDWHRTQSISAVLWYSGTPEPDLVDSQEEGKVLLVDIPGADGVPLVEEKIVGRFLWRSAEETVSGEADFPGLEERLRALPNPSRTLLRLTLRGTLTLSGRVELEERLAGIEAGMCRLSVRRDALRTAPSEEDLEALELDGVLAQVVSRLRERSADMDITLTDRQIAEGALLQLYGAMNDDPGKRRR